MYKPWPKCPKCSMPMALARPRRRQDGIETGQSLHAYECHDCEVFWDNPEGAAAPKVVK